MEARLAVSHTRTTQGEPVMLDLREGEKLKNVSLEVKRFYFLEPTNFAKFHKWNRGLDMVVQPQCYFQGLGRRRFMKKNLKQKKL